MLNTQLVSKIALLVVVFVVCYFNIRKMNKNIKAMEEKKKQDELRIRELRMKQEEENN